MSYVCNNLLMQNRRRGIGRSVERLRLTDDVVIFANETIFNRKYLKKNILSRLTLSTEVRRVDRSTIERIPLFAELLLWVTLLSLCVTN